MSVEFSKSKVTIPGVKLEPMILCATVKFELLHTLASIEEIEPFPEEPVTAITVLGRINLSIKFLSIFKAIVPGVELPLLRSFKTKIDIFPIIILNTFNILITTNKLYHKILKMNKLCYNFYIC